MTTEPLSISYVINGQTLAGPALSAAITRWLQTLAKYGFDIAELDLEDLPSEEPDVFALAMVLSRTIKASFNRDKDATLIIPELDEFLKQDRKLRNEFYSAELKARIAELKEELAELKEELRDLTD